MSTSAMHVAKTGLTAQQYKMQVIANNLANVNTTVLSAIEQILNLYSIKLLKQLVPDSR
ncbi:MAG: hypothetical protein CM15mP85_05210 [Rhodobacterales bacterium]|nr:MAG: hypothetical protein CM15mP85_05210 [Rhodobacterales bacterium]